MFISVLYVRIYFMIQLLENYR